MSTVVTGRLGEVALQGGELIGLIYGGNRPRPLFIRVPVDVTTEHAELLTTEDAEVELTGYLCDHESYFVVTGVAAA
jgi:hypothetical protein